MKVGILPCQGTCNVGNMTHKVALKLVDDEKINTVCSLGLLLVIPNIVAQAKINDAFTALNGCPLRCSSLALEKIGIKNYHELILTKDFGVEKNKNYHDESKMDEVEARVKRIIKIYTDNRQVQQKWNGGLAP